MMLKWVRRIVLVLILSAIASVAAIWIASEVVLRKSYADIPAVAPPMRGDVESGKHWAAILGCTHCHGAALEGNVMEDEGFWVGLLAAPNLTIQRKFYDDAGLARLIREGVKHDGHGVDTMPSKAFHEAADQTVADVIAFVRSVPDGGKVQPNIHYGLVVRWFFAKGEWTLAPSEIDHHAQRLGDSPHAEGLSLGRYIATLACGECHGLDQKGNPEDGIPNLVVAKAYSGEEFRKLMHDGIAKGDRKIRDLMVSSARTRFSVFTDEEVSALKQFLDSREP
jgi:cytochrome c553